MSNQNNTPPHPETFQMTQMMERMNFVMGNVCDRLDRVEKRGNEASTSTQNMRKLGAELKANNVVRVSLKLLLISSHAHTAHHTFLRFLRN
jgi:hypothetical protein